jgi:hypothetical protein
LETAGILLERKLGHKRICLVTAETELVRGEAEPLGDPVIVTSVSERILECQFRERLGWNGDQTQSFKGDEASWGAALSIASEHAYRHLQLPA